MNLRILNPADADLYHALRLRGLREAPTAFGSSAEEEQHMTREQVVQRIAGSLPENPTFGAFIDGALVGIVSIHRMMRPKTRHKGAIVGMYVAPEVRGQGVGRALVSEAIAYARTLPHLEELMLTVTVGNDSARHLYTSLGFETFAVEPRFLKLDERYYDGEWMALRLK